MIVLQVSLKLRELEEARRAPVPKSHQHDEDGTRGVRPVLWPHAQSPKGVDFLVRDEADGQHSRRGCNVAEEIGERDGLTKRGRIFYKVL